MYCLPKKWFCFVVALVTSPIFVIGSMLFISQSTIWAASEPSFQPSLGTPAMHEEEPILPLRAPVDLDDKRIDLGERLFNDPRLSKDDSISCASCHDLSTGGADGKKISAGIGGALGFRNAPTVFNSGYNFRQFWDGRAATLEDQIDGPLLNHVEMGSSKWDDILDKLKNNPNYVLAFDRIYDDGIQADNVKNAIATFERSLVTEGSRFDKFLLGQSDAITQEEKTGYGLFKSFGCIACHQGMNVGGNMFQKLGVFEDYFDARGGNMNVDYGRFNVTAREKDRFVFKVPSLRNVAITAPYFHDGSVGNLQEAVFLMAKYQLGRTLSGPETQQIVAFLRTLTGEFRGKPLWQ